MTTRLIRWLGWVSLAGLLIVGVWVFAIAPRETYMGFSQKIMYLHVPSIWVAYVAFFIVFVTSIVYLWKRLPEMDRVARSAAEVGVLFCGMALVTGAIWGRPTWGTYWVWDARLTTTLLLFLIYTGYVLLRAFAEPGEMQARLAAVIGIIGFLDIPLIHVSVQWWRTLHQPSTMFKVDESGRPEASMPPELLWPLLVSLVVMTVFFAFLLLFRLRLQHRSDALAERLAGE